MGSQRWSPQGVGRRDPRARRRAFLAGFGGLLACGAFIGATRRVPGGGIPASSPTAAPTGTMVTGTATVAASPTSSPAARTGTAPGMPGTWPWRPPTTLATTCGGADTADMAVFAPLTNAARVVGVGEATHGTSEFFGLRQRLLDYLGRERGFTDLAIEADWSATAALDAWVQGGSGEPRSLLAALDAWFYSTGEMLDVLVWLRAHNAATPDPAARLHLHGLDIQRPAGAIDAVLAYDTGASPTLAGHLAALYVPFHPYVAPPAALTGTGRYRYAGASAATRAQCRANLRAAVAELEARRDQVALGDPARELERAIRAARIVAQAEEYLSFGAGFFDESNAARDRALAENALWALDQAGPCGRLVVWAHNAHVGAFGREPAGAQAFLRMGDHLRATLGAQYVALALSAGAGGFNAVAPTAGAGGFGTPTAHELSPPPPDSYDALLAGGPSPAFLLDLRPPADGSEAGRQPVATRPFREIGTIYNPSLPEQFYVTIHLARVFDGVCQIQRTTPSVLLPAP